MKQTVHIGHRALALRIAAIYFVAAAAWIVGSDLTMLLWMPESARAVAGSIAKGLLFVAVTSVVLYVVLRHVAHMETQPAADVAATSAKPGWRVLAPFLALAAALIGATILNYVREARGSRQLARDQLELSAELKSRELGAWLEQQAQSALSHRRAAFFENHLRAVLDGEHAAYDRVAKRLEEIRQALAVDAILVLDVTGRPYIQVGRQLGVSAELAREAAEVAHAGQPLLHAMHRATDAPDAPPVLDQIVPIDIVAPGDAAPAVLVLRDDAESLFQILRTSVTPSQTTETYLVRRAGDRLQYLSELKRKPGTALTLGPLATDAERASAQLLRGSGFTERAIDYRGVQVLATSRSVPGTDWRVVAKVDLDEVLEPAWREAWIHLAMFVGLTILAALGASRLWRQQTELAAMRERALLAERDAVGKHLDLLSRYASDMILLLDEKGRIVQANERAVERYGYAREALIGMRSDDLRAPEDRAEARACFERVLREGGCIFEGRQVTAHGEQFPVEINARRIEVDGVSYVQGVVRDISERKQADAQIRRLNRIYAVLSGINSAIVRVESPDTLLDEACRIAFKKGGFPIAWAGVIDRQTNQVQPVAWRGVDEDYVRTLRRSIGSVAPGEGGVVGLAVRNKEPVISNDIVRDDRLTHGARAAERGSRALVVLPLLVANEPVGVLALHAAEVGFFDDQEMRLMRELAGDISFALGTLERDRALQVSRERIEVATRGAGFGVWDWWDVADTTRMWWSSRTYELLGLQPGSAPPDRALFVSRIHPDDRTKVEAALQEALRDAAPYDVEYRLQGDLPGRYYWLRSRGHRVLDASGRVVRLIGVIEDIDVRKRGEAALRESEQRFRAVLEQSIAAVYVAQEGKLVYANPRAREIFGYAPDEPINPDPMAHIAPHERGRVAEQMSRRLETESDSAYSIAALRKDGTPFTLGVHAKRASYEGRPAIIAVAQDITERARAEEEIKRYVARLEQAMRSTIEVVATIGEMRDPYTHGHERRVGELAAAIALEMGLDANRVEGLRIAGYLHDVGKIGVPAEILAKPARLTKPEFDLVKEHAQQSYEILKGVEFPWPVAQAAWQHHERLDGSGYPRGLKGDDIILEARILAVADVIEAMSSHRPYRPGHGIDAALAEIEQKRGELFDPQAVDACLRLFREKGYRLPA